MVLGIGETVLDILFRDDQPCKAVPGGSTFNSLISLGRAGCDCMMLSQCGDDHVGDITLEYLRSNGVSTDGLTRVTGMKSHISLAFLDAHSDAQYAFYKDHQGWNLSLLQERAEAICFTDRDVLLMGSFFAVNPVVRPVVKALLDKAHAAGALIYYDLNYRQPHAAELPRVMPYIEENIRMATIVRGSADDLRIVGLPDETVDILTDGPNPIRLNRALSIANAPIIPVSTVGAGDNFNAGFICAYIRMGLKADPSAWTDEDWLTMARMGQAWSRQVCLSWENSIPQGYSPV